MSEPSSTTGFNQWTIPWSAPRGPDLDALRSGSVEVPEFDLSPAQVDAYQSDGSKDCLMCHSDPDFKGYFQDGSSTSL